MSVFSIHIQHSSPSGSYSAGSTPQAFATTGTPAPHFSREPHFVERSLESAASPNVSTFLLNPKVFRDRERPPGPFSALNNYPNRALADDVEGLCPPPPLIDNCEQWPKDPAIRPSPSPMTPAVSRPIYSCVPLLPMELGISSFPLTCSLWVIAKQQ